jgi:hypothetical protein
MTWPHGLRAIRLSSMLAGVAEHPLDDFQVGVGGQREGGRAVAQAVRPDRRQPEVLAKAGPSPAAG